MNSLSLTTFGEQNFLCVHLGEMGLEVHLLRCWSVKIRETWWRVSILGKIRSLSKPLMKHSIHFSIGIVYFLKLIRFRLSSMNASNTFWERIKRPYQRGHCAQSSPGALSLSSLWSSIGITRKHLQIIPRALKPSSTPYNLNPEWFIRLIEKY
jgi:hypothetical protein